jgi:3-hydroxyisobutyryl-CoA hydrolase
MIDLTIEEFSEERQPEDPSSPFTGPTRAALDYAFRHPEVENIVSDLQSFTSHRDPSVQDFAHSTLRKLEVRSPTSLKVALKAIRQGKTMTLLEALNMELKIATAFCVSASPRDQVTVR